MTTRTKKNYSSLDRTHSIVTFAGCMLLIAGGFHALTGISALFNDDLYITRNDYVYSFDLTTWGWAYLILGLIVVGVGVAILNGQTWGRIAGVVLVGLSMITNFMFIPVYPLWAMMIITIEVVVIWALISGRQ